MHYSVNVWSMVNVSFLESGTAIVTIMRQGTYGSLSVDWATGELAGSLTAGVTNGEILPASGTISVPHGVESRNFTVQVSMPQTGEIFLG